MLNASRLLDVVERELGGGMGARLLVRSERFSEDEKSAAVSSDEESRLVVVGLQSAGNGLGATAYDLMHIADLLDVPGSTRILVSYDIDELAVDADYMVGLDSTGIPFLMLFPER